MPYNILVIDDDKATADSLADILRLLNHHVSVAYGPRNAFAQLSESTPDIVFVDTNMPGVDGLEVCRYMRRDPQTANTPIVSFSADGEKAHQDAAFMAGSNYYIVKPVMLEDCEVALGFIETMLSATHHG
ncbi:MAG: response regulator [Chloroflexota bacterium]